MDTKYDQMKKWVAELYGSKQKTWFVSEDKYKRVSFQRVPLFFLKDREQMVVVAEEKLFGSYVNVCQLRIWARLWLWLKKVSEIKVW